MQFPKQQRQAKLFKEFNFNCKCEACEQNYPTPPALNFKDIKLLKFAIKSEEDIMRSSIKDSRKIYQECCEKLEQNFNNYPCIELCMLQKAVALFMMKKSQMNLFIC
jgi:ribosomal protein S18